MNFMRFGFILLSFVFFIVLLIGEASLSVAQDLVKSNLEANVFIYDQNNNLVTAEGSVILIQEEQTLHADKIIYKIDNDYAYAEGNVLFKDSEGNSHYATTLELSNAMKQGLVNNLYTVLDDGSRMWASRAIRKSPEKHVLKDARYTPCKSCSDNPGKTPTWAIRASEVVHDKKSATISYDDVRFEALGTPIFYVPYFNHPDGTIDQKSGFLAPLIGFGSDYGFNAMASYYWAINPSMDATIGARVFTKAAPQINLEVRKRYENAIVETEGSFTYSDRFDSVNNIDVYRDEDFRGHFKVESLWNMNKHWRSGTDIKLTSDEQYLEQYDIEGNDDVLTNRIYAERFDDRDYASIELLAFQDLRLEQNVDQPNALPYANMSFIGNPNSLGGGRFKWDSSFLSLFREGNEQDMNRMSSKLAWQRRDVLPAGLLTRMDLSVRADAYYTSDRDISKVDPNSDTSKYDDRFIPTANFEMAYPLQKPVKKGHIGLKPKVGITVRPDVDNDSDIPNEDSVDAQIDVTNLFEIDRFPGLDRVEDRTRFNYGVETGYYGDNGDDFTVKLGQSYRLQNDDNPFPNGSGFEEQESDIVGQITAGFNEYKHNINYRFQLNGQKLNAERHEIFGNTGTDKTRLSAIYLYEKGSSGTEFVDSREQVQGLISKKINDNWSARAGALYDLGEDAGLRQSTIGVSYDDDCFGVTGELQRELQRDATGTNDTTVLVRFRLKNLGEFETTAYDYGSGSDNDL